MITKMLIYASMCPLGMSDLTQHENETDVYPYFSSIYIIQKLGLEKLLYFGQKFVLTSAPDTG